MTLITLVCISNKIKFPQRFVLLNNSKLQPNIQGVTINSSVSVVLTQKTVTGATAQISLPKRCLVDIQLDISAEMSRKSLDADKFRKAHEQYIERVHNLFWRE